MNDTPRTSQMIAGSQPQRLAATMAPTIGPAAAIDLKWYPNRMLRFVGMKSTPSMYRVAGVARFGSDWMTWRSIRRAERVDARDTVTAPMMTAIKVFILSPPSA